ncbi:hypothetical protein ACFY4K_18485 [Streptomyces leeuwenhoekii]
MACSRVLVWSSAWMLVQVAGGRRGEIVGHLWTSVFARTSRDLRRVVA